MSVHPPDYHVHTAYCGHASGSVEEMVKAAAGKGLTEMGFAEHHPYPTTFSVALDDAVVPASRWEDFLSDVREARETAGDRIQIRLGTEIDYLPGLESEYRHLTAGRDYDYIFGSVHILDGIFVDYQAEYMQQHLESLGGEPGVWQRYWDALEALIRAGLCDIVSHLDLPKKFGLGYPGMLDWDRIESILECIKENNLTLEINTGGIDRSISGEPYPSGAILKRAAALGIDVLIGSDAHHPSQVGRHFKSAVALLQSLGWKYLTAFSGREKSFLPLSKFF